MRTRRPPELQLDGEAGTGKDSAVGGCKETKDREDVRLEARWRRLGEADRPVAAAQGPPLRGLVRLPERCERRLALLAGHGECDDAAALQPGQFHTVGDKGFGQRCGKVRDGLPGVEAGHDLGLRALDRRCLRATRDQRLHTVSHPADDAPG